MGMTKRLCMLTMVVAIGTALSRDIGAYATTGVAWNVRPVPYSINTTNLDLPESAVEPAVRTGADVWATQSNASISLTYMGRSAQTTTDNDGLNLVVFRNASSGSAIATTYGGPAAAASRRRTRVLGCRLPVLLRLDRCSGGFYIEDIALTNSARARLGHSTRRVQTMYPSSRRATRAPHARCRRLAGVRFLYPAPRRTSQVQSLRITAS